MVHKLKVAGLSDAGRLRALNEDRFYFKYVQSSDEAPVGLFIVADGIGGHLGGEVASHWAVETLKREMAQLFTPRDPAETKRVQPQKLWASSENPDGETQVIETELFRLITYAVRRANEVLMGYAQQKPEQTAGMGSTVVLAVIQDGLATVANVGDSRAYLWREGQIHCLTHDHSLPGELVLRGQLPLDKVTTHPQRHILHRCLGRRVAVEPDVLPPVKLQVGDRFLLCSDGLWEMVTPTGRLAEVIGQSPDPLGLCQEMIKAANDAGGEDNITALAIYVEE